MRYLGEEANWICLIAAAFLCKSNSSAFFSYASITQLNASLPQIIFNTPTLNSVSVTCHNLVPLILGLLFHVICIFCSHPALVKIHTWKLFACGKIFAHGNIKSRRKFLVKKKLKNNNNNNNNKQALRGKKEYHSFKRRRRNSVKATAAGEAPRWLPEFEQRSHVQTKSITHRVKKKALIIHASTGLDRKHQQSPQIVI